MTEDRLLTAREIFNSVLQYHCHKACAKCEELLCKAQAAKSVKAEREWFAEFLRGRVDGWVDNASNAHVRLKSKDIEALERGDRPDVPPSIV